MEREREKPFPILIVLIHMNLQRFIMAGIFPTGTKTVKFNLSHFVSRIRSLRKNSMSLRN